MNKQLIEYIKSVIIHEAAPVLALREADGAHGEDDVHKALLSFDKFPCTRSKIKWAGGGHQSLEYTNVLASRHDVYLYCAALFKRDFGDVPRHLNAGFNSLSRDDIIMILADEHTLGNANDRFFVIPLDKIQQLMHIANSVDEFTVMAMKVCKELEFYA
mgnify:FL=1